jgi:hypothetical protein
MKLAKYLMLALIFIKMNVIAQETAINNFIIEENILKNEKITIIATNDDGKPIENINGTFQFSINGFRELLKFTNGTATASHQINKSAFVYLVHKNDNGTHAKLYYVIKHDTNLHPIKISWMLLLIVPLLLIILGILFRKFIIISIVLLGIIFFFNYSKGLDLSTFFETVYNGVKSIF